MSDFNANTPDKTKSTKDEFREMWVLEMERIAKSNEPWHWPNFDMSRIEFVESKEAK